MQTVQRYKRGQIWWLLDSNPDYKSYEQSGSRPVIIISNDTANRFSKILTVIPCTTAEKKDLPVHVKLEINGPSTALVEQIKTIDNSKLGAYIGTCDDVLINQLNEAIKIALGLVKLDYTSKIKEDKLDETVETVGLIKENGKLTPYGKVEPCQENPFSTKGRKPVPLEDKIRFINDYENHDIEFMLKKYNCKSKVNIQKRVYLYRKAIKEAS